VDDGSTDNSIQIAKVFQDRVTMIENKVNSGLGFALNLGLRNAHGRYVVRVDADDYVHGSFVKTLLVGFELLGRDYHALSVDYQKVDDVGNYLAYGDASRNPIACGIGFKMDALSSLGFYNEELRVNEEIDLRLRFDEAGFLIRNISLPLYRYVQHNNSLTRKILN
jgi:glycosyltransferase involved in cell wall biosynthesis